MNIESILNLDSVISNKLRVAEQPGPLRTIAMILGHSGDSWYLLLALLLTAWFGTPFWTTRAVILIASILITAGIVLVLKFTIRRQRPEGEWGAIYRKTDPHSFPSGHATRALMMGIVGIGIGPTWFGIILLIWGPLVGLARVAMGVHYILDVFAGWLVGIIMSLIYLQFTYLFI